MFEFEKSFRVGFRDTDCTGRVYFTTYAYWIDEAIIEGFRQRGLVYDARGYLTISGRPLQHTFVIGEYSCRIERPSSLNDLVTIKVKVRERRNRTISFEAQVVDSLGEILALAGLTYVCISVDSGKPADIPPEILKALF